MTDQHKNAIGMAALFAVIGLGLLSICYGQVERPKPKAVVLSADWFHCPHCGKAEENLEGMGCDVTLFKLSREQTKELHVSNFPTVLIGDEVVVGNEPHLFRRALR